MFEDDHSLYSLRRNPEMALEDKLRGTSGGDSFDLSEFLDVDFIHADARDSSLSPSVISSTSASSSPPEHRTLSVKPEQCANKTLDQQSYAKGDEVPYGPESLQRYEPEQRYFVRNGMVYEQSTQNCPSEDAPFIPTTPISYVRYHQRTPILASENVVGLGINPQELFEGPSTSLTPLNPEPQAVSLTSRRPVKRKSFGDSSDDDDGEGKNPTDDEYCPSPPLATRRKTRTSGSSSRRIASRVKRAPRSTGTKRPRGTAASRNTQSTSPAFLKAVNRTPAEECDFKCPECGWKQVNKRMPDYLRHLRTHARPKDEDQSRGWWCKGVRVAERQKYPIPADAKTYYFQDQKRAGGCLQTFSRRDALKRHLDNPNACCVGRPCSADDD